MGDERRTMKTNLKKILALLLVIAMLLSATGCSYVLLGCAAISCASCAKDHQSQIKDDIGSSVEDVQDAVSDLGDLFSNIVGDKPTQEAEILPKAPGLAAANEAFLALDREIFVWYVTSDITTLDQYCYDPTSFGIDESTVPVTLGDFSPEADAEWIADCRSWLEKLRALDAENLGDQNRFAYDNYVRYFENEIASDGLYYYYEPLAETVGLQVNLPLTFGLYEFKDKQDVENYLTLLADVPRYFGQVLTFEEERAARGLFMTEVMLDNVLKDFDNVIAGREDSYLFATFRDALQDVDWLTETEKETYFEQNDALVKGEFTDAYQTLRDGIAKLRPYCRQMGGAKEMGEDALRYYSLKLKSESACNMSVDEAIDFLDKLSLDLYNQLMAAYRKSSKKDIDFTTGTIESDERYLNTLITEIVPPMPDINVTYKEIPPELQDGFSPAAYLLPAVDHYKENTILTNPSQETDMMTLAHEGYPGHMFQYTYQYDLGTIPLFQMVIEPIGYAEGWSTSAEYSVAKRCDIFGAADATVDQLNERLTDAIIVIAGLLVNGKGVSKEKMTEYLAEWNLDSYADIVYEIAVNQPIYLFKYEMGFCQQYSITERCREIFNFNDKDFYTEYLSWGPSYFDLLEPKLVSWAKACAESSDRA